MFGDEHPDVSQSLGNLGVLLHNQGKYDEAEHLYQQSLTIRRNVYVMDIDAWTHTIMELVMTHKVVSQVYGDEHPNVAQSLNNLAELLRNQKKYEEAEPLFRQSLAIRRKVCCVWGMQRLGSLLH